MDIIHTRGSDMVSGPFYFFHAVVCCQAFSKKSEQAEKKPTSILHCRSVSTGARSKTAPARK